MRYVFVGAVEVSCHALGEMLAQGANVVDVFTLAPEYVSRNEEKFWLDVWYGRQLDSMVRPEDPVHDCREGATARGHQRGGSRHDAKVHEVGQL